MPNKSTALFLLLTGLIVALPGAAQAAERLSPGWMKSNPAKQTVELLITAAYNGNNGSWNFNGYYEGGATVVVPLGWTVLIKFHNPDGNYPHSLLLTRAFGEDAIPDLAGRDEVAIPRAYTRSPDQGCHSCKEDLRFKVKKAGRYMIFCGVVGHGKAGMWLHFDVSETETAPYVALSDNALGPDDQPGRP